MDEPGGVMKYQGLKLKLYQSSMGLYTVVGEVSLYFPKYVFVVKYGKKRKIVPINIGAKNLTRLEYSLSRRYQSAIKMQLK